MHICGKHLKHGHSFINHIFYFYVYEPGVILLENTKFTSCDSGMLALHTQQDVQ